MNQGLSSCDIIKRLDILLRFLEPVRAVSFLTLIYILAGVRTQELIQVLLRIIHEAVIVIPFGIKFCLFVLIDLFFVISPCHFVIIRIFF